LSNKIDTDPNAEKVSSDDHDYNIITDLQTLIRQPSVSAKNQGLVECANLVAGIMQSAGINAQLLYIDSSLPKNAEDDIDSSYSSLPPIVYGEVISKSNPRAKTILFYNHYDVQPEDPVELWDEDPFSGKVEGNCIFGRGSADDKGELITRIKAVEYYLKKTGDVPCNVKFLVEGEEEIGSVHIEQYLNKYRDTFSCDGVIWESGFIDTTGRPIISLGQKGILTVEITSKGPDKDVHSSLAALVENPVWSLVRALNTLRNDKGKILVRDWCKEVRDFTHEELTFIAKEYFDEDALRKEYGITNFLNNMQGLDVKKAFEGMPTCNISGLASGYTGTGSKTFIPSRAVTRIDFRLIPDMLPHVQFNRLKQHLKEHGFDDDHIKIRRIDGEPAARTPVNHPFVNTVRDAATEVYGDVVISVSAAGTGPMYYIGNSLGVPCICIGGTDISNRCHSPNEYMKIDSLNKTTKCMTVILEKFSH
jgi:acetylornithine deacetylase/succinyl-diaminopimelate desuccinylase-like protein